MPGQVALNIRFDVNEQKGFVSQAISYRWTLTPAGSRAEPSFWE